MKSLCRLLAVLGFSTSALAAGVQSGDYTCAGLHGLIATNGFVFIGNPDFEDFVVADLSYCPSGGFIQLRSVPTRDNRECLVNYCRNGRGGGS